jgi:signal transduction histidine kinase
MSAATSSLSHMTGGRLRLGFRRRSRRGSLDGGSVASPAVELQKEFFAAYVAHELRAPVALQRTLVEVTLADPGADNGALRKMGERVIASCERQQRLIGDLLDLARSRRDVSGHRPVDLAAITREALQANDLTALESVVVLEDAWTSGAPDLVALLAANLVSNAIQHNRPGGRIEVATSSASRCSHLTIANSGPTIPANQVRRLFEPFQRFASDGAGAADGVGLGLTIVQTIADAHNACIHARPRAGGGLEIDVSFPAPRIGGSRW